MLHVGSLHVESFAPLVLDVCTAGVILGHPWLIQHQLRISWSMGDVLRWGETCFLNCFPELPQPSFSIDRPSPVISVHFTSIESPIAQQSVDISCPICRSLMPEESLTTASKPTIGLISIWYRVSQFHVEEFTHSPHRVHRGTQAGLHPPFNFSCCIQQRFRHQEGFRLAALHCSLNNITIKFRYPLTLDRKAFCS